MHLIYYTTTTKLLLPTKILYPMIVNYKMYLSELNPSCALDNHYKVIYLLLI